jgi:hypothetical protein
MPVMLMRLFLRANFPMEPNLRIMTDADETVDESDILSVEALNFPLNRPAARDFGLVDRIDSPAVTGVIGDDPDSPLT